VNEHHFIKVVIYAQISNVPLMSGYGNCHTLPYIKAAPAQNESKAPHRWLPHI